MRLVALICAVMLAIPLVIAAPGGVNLANVNFVMDNVEPQQTRIGDIYVYSPQIPVVTGTTIPIGAVIVFNQSGIEVNLQLNAEGNVLNVTEAGGDISPTQPFYQREWLLNATEPAEYILTIRESGEIVVNQRIALDVQDRILVEETREPVLTRNPEPISAVVDDVRESFNDYQQSDLSAEEFDAARESAKSQVRVLHQHRRITRTYSDGVTEVSTEIQLRIEPLDEDIDAYVIQYIPKDTASSVDEIDLPNDVIILEEDPMIMWQITGPVTTSYELDGDPEITGQTIVVDNRSNKEGFPWDIVLPAVLIPLVAIIIFFFSRFEPKK